MNFSVTQYGKELDPSKYNWDPKTKTFSTTEDDLVLDFSNINGVTFDTGDNCTFKTGKESVIVRRDVFEIIQPKPEETIKLNSISIKGYTVVNPKRIISIDGKDIEISEESFQNLKKQLS